MKHHSHRNPQRQQGMTLIELLVVISIIGVLAGLLLPVIGKVKTKAKIVQAQKDMSDLKSAVSIYQNDYSRLPASSSAMATVAGSDFTYGTTGTGYGGGTNDVLNYGGNPLNVGTPSAYQASNAELMVILTGQSFPGYTPDASVVNNQRNPRKIQYFNAKPAVGGGGALAGAGLGTDGVMRDPWGSPYIISLDLNYDNATGNSVYQRRGVSQMAGGAPAGHFGLVGTGNGNNDGYFARDAVMIFSFGPDMLFDNAVKADAGVNRDNILNWK